MHLFVTKKEKEKMSRQTSTLRWNYELPLTSLEERGTLTYDSIDKLKHFIKKTKK